VECHGRGKRGSEGPRDDQGCGAGDVTTFLAVAYKSQVTILVPPGVRVEMTGFGVTQGADEDDPGYRLANDALVIHVRGIAYKGTVEITTRPPERPALRR
jgi:hypothetical protein